MGGAGDPLAYVKPEQRARMRIDERLTSAGWAVQDYGSIALGASRGVAVREFPLVAGPVDYLLFVDKKAVGVVEAKPDGTPLTGVEWQSKKYSEGVPDSVPTVRRPLPFVYESTGNDTRFTNLLDPEAASRRVFAFHQPETFAAWLENGATLRNGFRSMPPLDAKNLWPAQATAIENLEESLAHLRARALIQMATGSGKTYTAANIAYRLVKHGGAQRVLFLVDRANLGRQTLREFQAFETPDDGRKFTELYNVQHLTSNTIDPVARVVITTIQRLYSILRGDAELDESSDEASGYELEPAAPVAIDYNPEIPIETFDVVVVDECHRSIYGVWRQVLEYFDAFMIGLTATPGKQTSGFFGQNLVMAYGHDQAVVDNVNVDFDVFRIRTEITERGSRVDAGLVTRFRDRETRAERLEKLDDDIEYDEKALDRAVVAKDQIRTVLRAFREALPTLFPGRAEVPKTLIFAKSDAHADDIVQMVREEFGKGNEFTAKITYKSGSTGQKPEDLLASFRNSYNPRIAVTVDMIATGTDVKPLECVMFMRMVRSRTFFEQMKGRGVRVINPTDLQVVTPSADVKDRFVLIDAVGVTDVDLADTQPLERNPTVGLDKLLQRVALGTASDDDVSSLAGRIARLNVRLSLGDRYALEATAGVSLTELAGSMVDALDPERRLEAAGEGGDVEAAAAGLMEAALAPLADNPEFRHQLLEVRKSYDQMIDEFSKDVLLDAEVSAEATERAKGVTGSFRAFLDEHRDEIAALQILYSQPYGQRKVTFEQIQELAQAIERPPRRWTPEQLWRAYDALEGSRVHGSPKRVLTDLVSLVRFAIEQSDELVPYPELVAERFAAWVAAQEQAGRVFTDDQLVWLEQIRDTVATSLGITTDDFDYTPFAERGGIGRAVQLFGDELGPLLDELNEALVA